jgi:type IV pilus assembly protein PilM
MAILSKNVLGIDIGTFGIKIAELSSFGGRKKLTNYALLPAHPFYQRQFLPVQKSLILLPAKDLAEAIKISLFQSKIKQRNVVFAIPDFLTFFVYFTLPNIPQPELEGSIKTEARKYIPLPIKDVILDWQPIYKEKEKIDILLVAVPREIVFKFEEIASLANLKILALEPEIFALKRVLSKEREKVIGLIDIGAKSTTCSILDKEVLKVYHSLPVSGLLITEKIARELGVNWELADKIKMAYGISNFPPSWSEEMKSNFREIVNSAIQSIFQEIEKTFHNFYLKEGKEIDKIIITGGLGLMPGLLPALQALFSKPVELINPFSDILIPDFLSDRIKEISVLFSIAIGASLKKL